MMKTKRFIAGAVCPSCGAMDSIRMFRSETQRDYRECVECDYSDVMDVSPALEGDLPEARITREEKALEEHTDVIRFVDASSPSDAKH
ncbi:YheV family putative zinc ribbon protein [Endozoicomonas ascidiicola]|uniref:YheV family putative zinc ribbon protein n=1 Tax=Endozoicomonas ascidiicola TaxID=1698521 RepID=UPI000AB6CA5A|nr:YheV family putative zinc ribbon protein [Endozoicomonas ascidiicola]